ncbi:Threonine/homoserine efflux transporter RhtA [Paenibacillus tianmuensis]|uniref:Threonine/homoserine efflux transporter RhtA n=1 Tax=Paenibacillus tianmuensis TaxID=624147 RepID=A0A1G4SYP5_9BACL|nr:DMT family transporter [Paenibacillus tianmuensis]SCW74273.1 Threonine/homoserine efflux transporter RhtA [Paenibacillus tianmuensis]
MRTEIRADLMMLGATMLWASSYLFTKVGLQSLDTFNLIALRLLIAFLLSALVFHKRIRSADWSTLSSAFVLGSILFLSFVFITFGVRSTSASNAGFLVGLSVIFVPILSILFLRKKPEARLLLCIGLAIVGIGLLTLTSSLTINQGDMYCILGSLLFAVHMLVTGSVVKKGDAIALGVLQLGFAGLWALSFSFLMETPKLPDTFDAWWSILGLSILCSAVAFVLQVSAQKYASPTRMALIFGTEPLFAAIFAFVFAGEMLTSRGYVGAALLLLSVFLAQTDVKKLLDGKRLAVKKHRPVSK